MSSLQKCKSAKPKVQKKFSKNNCRFSCIIHKKFVPLQHSCKMTSGNGICGIAKEKIFLSRRDSFSWLSSKSTKEGIGFKENELFLHP